MSLFATNQDDAPAIEVRGLSTRLGGRTIHRGLDLTVHRGEVLGVVGKSGAGKSVLLDTVIGLRRAQAGTVRVLGENLATVTPRARAALKRRWGVLFQQGALFSNLTVRENVAAPLVEHTRLPIEEIEDLADIKIHDVGLPLSAGRLKPAELSGGMRKRAALARALVLDPELLFLDEPTSGLDPVGAADFDRLIGELRAALDLTVFMITHDQDTLHAITDRVAFIADQRVTAVAPVAVLEASSDPDLRDYFHGARGDNARRRLDAA